jgi:rare lipoprotein A
MVGLIRRLPAARAALIICAALSLAACAGGGTRTASVASTGQPKPPPTDIPYKLGKPYTVAGVRYVPRDDRSYDRTGMASWYGKDFHGKRTATGRRFNMYEMTAAHTTLPTGTLVKVTNLENGRSVIVVIADRGPFTRKRIIDLSYAAAKQLGFVNKGTARVRVTYYKPANRS